MAGTEAADVDRLGQLVGQERTFGPGQAAREQQLVERVVLLDGQDQRVLGKLGRQRLVQLRVAELRRRDEGCLDGTAELRLRADGSEEQRNRDRERQCHVSSRPLDHPTQTST